MTSSRLHISDTLKQGNSPVTSSCLKISSTLNRRRDDKTPLSPLVAATEKIHEKGEDAFFSKQYGNVTTIAVFDGLGGRIGGFEASRIAVKTLEAHCSPLKGKLGDIGNLQASIKKNLADFTATSLPTSRLKGSLAGKRACTTMAVASIDNSDGKTKADIAWIGDSRIYTVEPSGFLVQHTKDDAEGHGGDAPMTQFLSADMEDEWAIHQQSIDVPQKALVIAATDGCYGYFPNENTDLQYAIHETLQASSSMSEWQSNIQKKLQSAAADDTTLAMFPVGFSSFEEIKTYYAEHNPTMTMAKSMDHRT